ncbi:MAG: imidazole glycerol phosphate synthase subunit HisH [Rhodospirillales bacterium]|nr:imidazole glycerol phosphate synthase subunit HisH [Rhodospirillales bacterium]
MNVVIVDYGSGNLRSAAKAFERTVADDGLDVAVRVTSEPADVANADHIVLPGVGAFADCRRGLDALPGMVDALEYTVIGRGRPFLGICVGMQLMARVGLEHGVHAGLGWLDGEVALLPAAANGLKIPHMGWNDLVLHDSDHPLLYGLDHGAHAYFVHSYALRTEQASSVLAHVDYGGPVTAIVGSGNLVGTQFHPEKSQATGLRLISNFLRWRP